MITFEDAYAKAKQLKPTIDNCTEYENGYVFGCRDDDSEGTNTPCVIMKESGKAINMPSFVISGTGEGIRHFDLN